MKKLQVMIEDVQMKKLKQHALDNDVTLKDIITSMIENFFKETVQPVAYTKQEKAQEPKPKQDYNPDEVFVIRKTHKTKEEPMMKQYRMYGVEWMVWDGVHTHYDKDGSIIPFRFTDSGKVIEPDDEDIQELEKATGKKVVFE